MPLSYAHGAVSEPLLGETIGENLARTAARVGDRDALVSCHQGVRLTYAELDAAVDQVARGLLGLGLRAGDRMGIWSPNNVEWVLVQYATARVGIVLVNVNPAYRTSELQYALRQSGCRALVSAPAFKSSDYAAMIEEVRPSLPALERVVLLGTPDWEAVAAGEGAGEEDVARAAAAAQFDDPINIQYTSGTTGFPKGATLSHHNILNNGFFIGEHCRYTEADRVCIPVPFYHCFGMVLGNLACTTHGACMVLPAAAFEPEACLEAVQAERCTALYGVPTMFIAELDHPRFGELRPLLPAHRDHGGLPVPGGGHEAGGLRHAHGRGDHLLRHDRDRAGVDPDRGRTIRWRSGWGRWVGCIRTSRSRSPTPTRGTRCPAASRASCCTRGYSVMLRLLGRPRPHRRGDRRGALDAHRRSGRRWTTRATSTSSAGSRT